jgi:hypothetical protein
VPEDDLTEGAQEHETITRRLEDRRPRVAPSRDVVDGAGVVDAVRTSDASTVRALRAATA